MGWRDWSFAKKLVLIISIYFILSIIFHNIFTSLYPRNVGPPENLFVFIFFLIFLIPTGIPYFIGFWFCGVESASELCMNSVGIIFTLIEFIIIWLIILGIYWLIGKIKQR